MNWHRKDLHSNPNCPYFPNRVGSKPRKDKIQPNIGVNIQAYLNRFISMTLGYLRAKNLSIEIPKVFNAVDIHNPYPIKAGNLQPV